MMPYGRWMAILRVLRSLTMQSDAIAMRIRSVFFVAAETFESKK